MLNVAILPASVALVAALASYLIGFGVLARLRAWQMLDRPNNRSSHETPVPRGGGIGIVFVFVGGTAVVAACYNSGYAALIAATTAAVGALSFVDDRKSLPWRMRLGAQLLAAVVLSLSLLGMNGEGAVAAWLLLPLAILLTAGFANAYNFMDGINGLAAGQAVVSGLGLALFGVLLGAPVEHPAVLSALVLAGAAAGFVPHNFPRARMFMGDVGSVSLGMALMAVTLWLARDLGWRWLPVLAIVHLNFIADTGVTLVRRWLRREILHEAHREHFYQRLIRAGWSHSRTTGSELAINSLVIAAAAIVLAVLRSAAPVLVVVAAAVWCGFMGFAEWVFVRRSTANARTTP